MTKAEFVEQVATAYPSLSKRNLNSVMDTIFDTLAKGIKKDGRFHFPGFGTWTLKKRAAREGRNPQTGAKIKIKAYSTVVFKPSAEWKQSLR